jgi:DNA-directed RNA polymerase subunit F
MYSENAGIASNPANGINNIHLGGGDSSRVSKNQLNKLLKETIDANPETITELKAVYEDFILKVQNENVKKKLGIIIRAIDLANDPRRKTVDPATGKKDPNAKELAQRLYRQLNRLDGYKENPMENNTTEATVKFNLKVAQAPKKKKKTRGNPFRVLMGKVGKLLDHGIEKSDIVRYLSKQKYWNNETIEKAVDLVKDYNKKKERKTKSSSDVNLRTAADTIYDVEQDYNKISTIDLIQRAIFLLSVVDTDKKTVGNDGKEPVEKNLAKKELELIKKALKERDYDLELVKNLGLGGKNG